MQVNFISRKQDEFFLSFLSLRGILNFGVGRVFQIPEENSEVRKTKTPLEKVTRE